MYFVVTFKYIRMFLGGFILLLLKAELQSLPCAKDFISLSFYLIHLSLLIEMLHSLQVCWERIYTCMSYLATHTAHLGKM